MLICAVQCTELFSIIHRFRYQNSHVLVLRSLHKILKISPKIQMLGTGYFKCNSNNIFLNHKKEKERRDLCQRNCMIRHGTCLVPDWDNNT